MTWRDSEGTQRAVEGSRLIHKFQQDILNGNPVGGVFHAVNTGDMRAVSKAVGFCVEDQVSCDLCKHLFLCMALKVDMACIIGGCNYADSPLSPDYCMLST